MSSGHRIRACIFKHTTLYKNAKLAAENLTVIYEKIM